MIRIVYVTSSDFKVDECVILRDFGKMPDGTPVKDLFEFEFRRNTIPERLEVSIDSMVRHEVRAAYELLRVPCIVEHAGLIFENYRARGYPGGLTKPMWKALDADFVRETSSGGRKAIALAVVAYCDGMEVQTFKGETTGIIADSPRGKRQFYWDTVFVPDDGGGRPGKLTYAEICDDPNLGSQEKVIRYSQSTKAMMTFLEYRRTNRPKLWQDWR